LSPPQPKLLLVTLLYGWATGPLLRCVALLGVIVGDWALFSLGLFPLYLYNSLVLSTISTSPVVWVGLPRLLSSYYPRTVWIKELIKPTVNMCSTNIPLGSTPLIFSVYLRFKLLKWLANSSSLFIFLNTKSPTFEGNGINCFFHFS
jgi:hypothetical protein